MMSFHFLGNTFPKTQAIAIEVGNSIRSRCKSPASSIAGAGVLCGMVAILGLSVSTAAPEIFNRVKASSAIWSGLGVTVPAAQPVERPRQMSEGSADIAGKFSGFVGEAQNSPLSGAVPLVVPEAEIGSYAGRIEGNLHDTLVRADVPVEIREQIARIFASRLDVAAPAQKGDTYRVFHGRDAAAPQRRRVTAVELRSGAKVYQAVWFVAPGHANGDYYSFDGRRLAAEPFSMPLDYVRVSSTFGNRVHPVGGKQHFHTGVDFSAPKGTPVVAAASGTVKFVGNESGYGQYVVLNHPQGYTTYYAHLSSFARDLRVGASVTEGQRLGAVGSTGRSTGPHLHFEVRRNNHPTDPLALTSRTGASPLTASQRIAFDGMTGAMREQLAALTVDAPTVRTASNAGRTLNHAENPKDSLV
ncbi:MULTISPECIES: M23 family metallopeptidase [unclassified Paraburkholderia]|uniref:M23 family metallopeptidase n=1 Tax=unclassified Paraburkholderia TaxID=2615204 RepID=UPI0018374F51|nr:MULTISPECIES: M23 family metallopeptidase [unclassified Paraburkholderia]MBB5412260.1 murein DD-endopeptidase MepM/ murein hydrolase activator NlpD [Paraburkholderia sp. HC6.4b]MBB5454327.1 murein DD-endopeptidase MepM/ murein hydrolase activator NlpD [Paraburkholderia sp. Kb1A]